MTYSARIDAELMDPQPNSAPSCACVDCRLYRMGLR